MSHLDLDDTRLFFTDDGDTDGQDTSDAVAAGTGEPLLLVHGYTADSHDWSWQIPHFVADRRVIAVDLRGHGASSAPTGGYTTAEFAEDLVALLDHLDVVEVVAIGHSMGASVVSALAVEHPERVAAVVAVDPAYLMDDDLAGALGPVLDALGDDDLVPFVQGLVGEGMASPARDAGLRTWQVRRIATIAPHVLRQTLLAQVSGMAQRSESEPYLRRRRCPVLSFHTDPTRAALEAATFATSEERSRVVTWEGSGHWLHQERSAEFNAVVSGWLASIEGGA